MNKFTKISIRSLLLLVAVLCAFLAWRNHIHRRFETALNSIQTAGGEIFFESQAPKLSTVQDTSVYVVHDYDSTTTSSMKAGTYNPRSSVGAASLTSPEHRYQLWECMTSDPVKNIRMVEIPVYRLSNSVIDQLKRIPNLKAVVLTCGPTPAKQNALATLELLQRRLINVECIPEYPDFEVGKVN